jgi:DNA-binding transcriptional ArsR family regulator
MPDYMATTTPRRSLKTKGKITVAPVIVREMLPHAEQAATLLRALANEQRLMILCNLSEGELSVSQLNERLPLNQSALSQHLAVLRKTGIVTTRREAQTVYYSLKPGPGASVIDTLHDIYCS